MHELKIKLEAKVVEVKDDIAYIAIGMDGKYNENGELIQLDISKLKDQQELPWGTWFEYKCGINYIELYGFISSHASGQGVELSHKQIKLMVQGLEKYFTEYKVNEYIG